MDPVYTLDPKKTYKIPSKICYACDDKAIGVTTHNGRIKAGCKRHANPKITKVRWPCQFCGELIRSGGLDFGMGPWDVAHKGCYELANADIGFNDWK